MPRLTLCLAFIINAWFSQSARGEVAGIQAKVEQPIAARGSIMMLPLAAAKPGDHWPQTMSLVMADGAELQGEVAWLYESQPSFERQWTTDPRGLAIRSVIPSDDTSSLPPTSVLGPYLLVRLPLDGQGTLQLGAQTLSPHWIDVPNLHLIAGNQPAPPDDLGREILPHVPSHDRPDPVSPFEYWRWVLLAERMEMLPPKPFGGNLERMAAECYAALWQIGLARVHNLSPRIAQEIRDSLTRICIDQRQPFAAWDIDPAQLGTLLGALVDRSITDADALSSAVAWIDARTPLMIWPEREYVDQVELAIVTRTSEPVMARISWRGFEDPPIAVQIEPGVLMRVKVDRPPLPKPVAIGIPAPPEPTQYVLSIEARQKRFEFPYGPRQVMAKPPAAYFRPLTMPLTLFEVQSNIRQSTPVDRATQVQVRKLNGRWEIFFECRRFKANDADGPAVPEEMSSLDELRGIEAVTVLLGPDRHAEDSPLIWITIPESGFWRVIRGVNDGTLQVHRKSFQDRWNCRLVLPDAWFSGPLGAASQVGVVRSHGDSNQLEIGPGLAPPWRTVKGVGRAALDLTKWDDLPQPE